MTGRIRTTLALGAVLLSAGILNACGGGVPSNAVAKVGDATISKAAFDHWLTIANNSSAATGTARPPVPDPPNFTNCVSYLLKTAPKPAAGQAAPTAPQLKAQCQTQYNGLRDQVMQFLVSADWLQGEASDQGVKVSNSQVTQTFNQLKQQQFPTDAQFQTFLANSGMTLQDLMFRVRLDSLSGKIRQKVTGAKGKVTQAQISTYYDQNKSRFATPERRDLRLILTRTAAQASQALAAVRGGQSFSVVAQRFSTDQASKAKGGALTGVTRGTQEHALDTAIFAAPVGKLEGPIKTPFGYYVFRVQKITPASQQTRQQANASIQQLLTAQQQQTALTGFVKTFDKKWKSRTSCRSGFVIQSCSNAPKPSTTTTPGSSSSAPPQSTTTGR